MSQKQESEKMKLGVALATQDFYAEEVLTQLISNAANHTAAMVIQFQYKKLNNYGYWCYRLEIEVYSNQRTGEDTNAGKWDAYRTGWKTVATTKDV